MASVRQIAGEAGVSISTVSRALVSATSTVTNPHELVNIFGPKLRYPVTPREPFISSDYAR